MEQLASLWQSVDGTAAAAGLQAMDLPTLLALAAALGWASGLRLYAVLFAVGLAGALDGIELPAGLQVLQHPALLVASGLMLATEFLADKVPGLDSLWDLVHSFIRVPGGAVLAAAVFGADHSVLAVLAGLLGGTLAATAHAGKLVTRAAVNTSPEPFSNIALSLLEDGLVLAALWLAVQHPLAFMFALAVVLVLTVLLIVFLFRFLRATARRLAAWFQPSPVA